MQESVNLRLTKAQMDYITNLADREYSGNRSEALRFCVSMAKGVDEFFEELENKAIEDSRELNDELKDYMMPFDGSIWVWNHGYFRKLKREGNR